MIKYSMTTKHTFLRFSDCFVSHSIVTYYRIINKSNTTCATSGAELVYPSKSTQLTPGCSEVHVCSISSFLAVLPRLYCWLFIICYCLPLCCLSFVKLQFFTTPCVSSDCLSSRKKGKSDLVCVLTFWVPCCDVRYDFRIKSMLGSSLPPVVYRVVLVLFTLFVLCLRIVVSNIYCVVFLFGFLRFVYPVLPVSLDYPFLIDPSVFSNVYYT
jgi:hypothetical protein